MKKNYILLPSFLIVLLWSTVIFGITAIINNSAWPAFLSSAADAFYMPNANFCSIGIIGKLNALFYIYLILFLSLITIYILKRTLWRLQEKPDYMGLVHGVVWGTFLLSLILQTAGQTRYFSQEIKRSQGKAVQDRYPDILRDVASFAKFCQQKLPAPSSCQFASDFDLSKEPGMFLHRFLAYQLYPVDIRGIRRDADHSACLIVFAAQNPASHVPEQYDIIGRWGPYDLLAVKKPEAP